MTQQEREEVRHRLQVMHDTFAWLRFFLVTERPTPLQLGREIDYKIELLIALLQAHSDDPDIRRLGECEVAKLQWKQRREANEQETT